MKENERLRAAARKLETENAALRTQLKSNDAIREALKKIEELEREKDPLVSQFTQAEAVTSQYTTRYTEIEEERPTSRTCTWPATSSTPRCDSQRS